MEDKKPSDEIIKKHVIFAMTAGAIPIPLADLVAVSAIQYDMIKQLADSYGADYDSNKGKTLASSLMGAAVFRVGSSLIKAIPGVGTALGIGSQVITAGATTYAMGRILDSHFKGNGTVESFNLDSVKAEYNELLKKGKEYAKTVKKNFSREDVFETIEKLNQLKASGAITEEEFQRTKERLLTKIG